jgi:selenocysteine-specific elongation factor
LVRVNHRVAIASAETVLSKKQRARMDQILAIFAGSRTPPTAKELAALLQTTLDVVESLVRIATQHQTLIDIGGGFLLSRAVFVDIVRELRSLYDMHPAATVAQIRDHLGITRKHAIPLLEYCDQIGVTQRTGDERAAGVEIDRILATHGSGDD